MLHQFKNKIFRRSFSMNFTLIFITFASISVVLLVFTRHSLEAQQLLVADSYRRSAADAMKSWLHEKEQDIKGQVVYLSQFQETEYHSIRIQNFLRQQLNLNTDLEDLFIVDQRGRVINSKDDAMRSLDLSRFSFFTAGMRGRSIISELFNTKDHGQYLLIFTPIFRHGRPRYLLGTMVNLDHLAAIIDRIHFGKLGHGYLIDRDGQLLIRSGRIDPILERYRTYQRLILANSYAVRQVLQKKTGMGVYRDPLGQKVLGSYEWMNSFQIGLIVEFSERMAMQPLIFLFRVIIILTGLVGLLGLIMSYLVSRKTTQHLNQLVEAAANITHHAYQKPLTLNTDSELDILIDKFNEMQIAIQAREKVLQERNFELKTERSQALEATKMKSQFLANMSHELRTPLNSIIGFTGRVIKKSRDLLPPVQLENLEIVAGEAQHLLELINDLLDFSKIEAGRMEANIEPFNLVEVIREVERIVEPFQKEKAVGYVKRLSNAEVMFISSDRMKVKQILINLLSNAFKYSEKGIVTLTAEIEAARVRIAVADQGVGIPPESLSIIFDEFRQIDGSYTRKVGGTGLGLSITKNFVALLQGEIEVQSIPGKGSTFTIILPLQYEAPSAPAERVPAPAKNEPFPPCPAAPKIKVACVDDDPAVCRLYRQYLEESAFEILMLDPGADVTAQVVDLKPNVVLLDIILPYRDGWNILAELKTNPETRKIPVIMASVLNEKNLADQLNADEYLVKPTSQQELIATINRVVSGKKYPEVLIADDDENYLNLISQILKEEPISFRLAGDGGKALQMIAAKKPDLLLLDIMMPQQDGLAVLEEIRKRPEWNDIAIIMVTSKSLSKRETASLKKEVRQIIEKSGSHITDIMAAIANIIKDKAV